MITPEYIEGTLALFDLPIASGRGSSARNEVTLKQLSSILLPDPEAIDLFLWMLDIPPTTYKHDVKIFHKWLKIATADHQEIKRTLRKYHQPIATGPGSFFRNRSTYRSLTRDYNLEPQLPQLSLDVIDVFAPYNRKQHFKIRLYIHVSDSIIEREIDIKVKPYKLEDEVLKVYRNRYASVGTLTSWERITGSTRSSNLHVIENGKIYSTLSQDIKNVLDQELYNNASLNCVTTFAKRFNLDGYYDGMTTECFIAQAIKDNIQVLDNQLKPYEPIKNPFASVIAYNGHVLSVDPSSVKYPCVKENVKLSDEEFDNIYDSAISSHEQIVHDIKIYTGVYGKMLNSFCIDNEKVRYVRQSHPLGFNPTLIIKNILKPYCSSFYSLYEKNHAIYSGHATYKMHAYDLKRAYINAFKNITVIPCISNLKVSPNRAMAIDSMENWVVVTDKFKYCGVSFPPSLLYYTEAVAMNAPIKYCHHIDSRHNVSDLYSKIYDEIANSYINIYDKPSKYKIINELKRADNITDYVDQCLRLALGSMISDNRYRSCERVYVGYLDQIMSDDFDGARHITPETLPFIDYFYCNIHFAMSVEYRKLMMEAIELKPSAVFVDCVYFKHEVTLSDNFRECASATKDCERIYQDWHDGVEVIKGTAGSGKTYSCSSCVDLVIVPQNRLQLAWNGVPCRTYQYFSQKHTFPVINVLAIDEAFQSHPKIVNSIIGFCIYNGIEVKVIGDPYQLQPICPDVDAPTLNAFMFCDPDRVFTHNYRNSINYKEILTHPDTPEYRKEIFDKYLADKLVDESDDIVYCYRTGLFGTDSTREKHEQLYAQRVKGKTDYYVRCTRCCTIHGEKYYNGMIYPVNDHIRNSSAFVISNVYSIYTTQGQSITDLKLLAEDREFYYQNMNILYVLISRIVE